MFPQVIDLETSAASLSYDEEKHLRALKKTRNSSGVSQSQKLKTASKNHLRDVKAAADTSLMLISSLSLNNLLADLSV